MSDDTFSILKNLPMKMKKQRQKKYQYQKIMSTNQMKCNLQDMIKTGMKNMSIIQFIRSDLLNEKISSEQKICPRRVRSQAEEEVISKIQEKNFNFFIDKMETKHFKRGIDQVLTKLNARYTLENQKRSLEMKEAITFTNPTSPLKTTYSKMSKVSLQQLSRRKRTRQLDTLTHKDVFELNKVLTNDNDARRKRSNTFLFNIPTRKIPRKSSSVEYDFQRDWEDQLAQNINSLQGSQIKNKKNLKIDREKLSSYLKSLFINEVITTYYKFEVSQSFTFFKTTLEEMIKIGEKELKLITFFTYDLNQDGFICEEDIYYFISKLPYKSKILEDFNLIIQFLRKNKLRSSSTNLPDKLLKWRQKSQFSSLNDPNTSFIREEKSVKKNSFTQKLFTVSKKSERQVFDNKNAANYKKFQINFEVFTLIFAQKLPVLIPEIIYSLLRPMNQNSEPHQLIEQTAEESFVMVVESKQKQWSKRMNKTKQFLLNFHNENKKLSEKIQ